jgi:hypothetical protein
MRHAHTRFPDTTLKLVTKADFLRPKVLALEALMLRLPRMKLPVREFFANKGKPNGAYARELFIPKGTLLTGKIHKTEQINIMSKGLLSVLTEDGVKLVAAPFTVVSPAGTKRIAYAHEDTVWTTFHATPLADVEQIEAHFVCDTEQEWLEVQKLLRGA